MVVGTVLDILFSSFLQCQTCNFHLSHAICFCRVQISCFLHWTSTWTTGCTWYMHEKLTRWHIWDLLKIGRGKHSCNHLLQAQVLKSNLMHLGRLWFLGLKYHKSCGCEGKAFQNDNLTLDIFIPIPVGTKGLLRALSNDPLNFKSYGY